MKKEPKILLVTPGLPTKISHLADSFNDLYSADVIYGQSYKENRIDRILNLIDRGNIALNKKILAESLFKAVSEKAIDLIIIIKGLSISKETLKSIKITRPKIKIICWTCDDLALKHNQSSDFISSANLYDCIYTSKSNNIINNELEKLGFSNVKFFYQRYSKKYHNIPIEKERSKLNNKVFFAGFAEESRFNYMNYLAKNGIIVDVYGNGWDKLSYKLRKHRNLILHLAPVVGKDYANSIYESAINLCFLRVLNRDIHTSRSLEIPACGGFMLAERTIEHETLFQEGVDAEFFNSKEELLEKTLFYLKNKDMRIKVAKNGFNRTRKEAYSYDNLSEEILSTYYDLIKD